MKQTQSPADRKRFALQASSGLRRARHCRRYALHCKINDNESTRAQILLLIIINNDCRAHCAVRCDCRDRDIVDVREDNDDDDDDGNDDDDDSAPA